MRAAWLGRPQRSLASSDAAAAPRAGDAEVSTSRAVAALACVNGVHFYSICSIFPYAGFLAVHNGWAPDVDAAGYVVGVLASCTVLARIPTSVLWGYAADRFGSKVCLQCALAAIAAGSVSFGFSRELWCASLSRSLFLGGLNGWPTLTGLTANEVGGEAGQAAVLSRVIAAGAIFGLIGPAIGGWTYASVPACPPALPPNLIGAGLCACTSVLVHLWIPTHPGGAASSTRTSAAAVAGSKVGGGGSRGSTFAALCTPPLPLIIMHRTLSGLYMYVWWDVFPLFAIASEGVGGLTLDHAALGTLISCAALVQTTYMMTASARVIRTLGIKCVILCTAAIQGASLGLLPFARLASPLKLPAVTLLYALSSCSNGTSVVVATTATNKCAARHPERKGAINGIATTAESVGKAIGPIGGATLFALALEGGFSFGGLGGAGLFFCCFGSTLAATYVAIGAALPSALLGRAGAARAAAHEASMSAEAPRWVELGEASTHGSSSEASMEATSTTSDRTMRGGVSSSTQALGSDRGP